MDAEVTKGANRQERSKGNRWTRKIARELIDAKGPKGKDRLEIRKREMKEW